MSDGDVSKQQSKGKDEAANEDVDMADGDVNKAPKAKRRSDVKLGQEFKAKVCIFGSVSVVRVADYE